MVLTYHVVPGRLTFDELQQLVRDGKGTATLTVSGDTLSLTANGPHNIALKDSTTVVANISIYDVLQSNGVIHSIDKVLLPSKSSVVRE